MIALTRREAFAGAVLMSDRIPQPIRPLVGHYTSLLNQQIPGLMKAFYLEGSIALGGFNEHFSDIDFVTLLTRQLSSAEFDTLRNIHRIIRKSYPRWKMSGSYLQSDHLERESKVDAVSCYEGKLRPRGNFDWNWVPGWILKNHGVAVIGPEPQALPVTVDWNRLIERMRGNLNSYWAGWTRRPDAIGQMLFDLGVQWAVLGVLRQFYSFREGTITTKTKAGEYALTCVPSRWHRLIREAIDIREGERASANQYRVERRKASSYPLRIVRTIEAVKFLKFMIQICNEDEDIDEAVHLESYRAKWAADFAVERERLRASLGIDLGHIEHIGSTAVPGLEAKPIIDIMLGLSGYPPSDATIERLVALGYEALGEAGVPGRTYLRFRGNRSINLHVVELGAGHWARNLALRDYLRNSAPARERYASAKRAALASGKETLLAYSAAKSPIIAALLSEAGVLDTDG